MRATIRWAWMAALLLAMGTAQAQRVEGSRAAAQGPYEAEVSVRSQSAAERNTGFSRGLIQVLAKLTGEQAPQQRPGIGEEVRNAKEYVASYDYRQDEGVSPTTGAPSFGTTLIVRFRQAKVDELAKQIGTVAWPNPRPKPVLWLAIDDGSGPRLVGLPQANAARSLLDRARARGYSLGLPRGSAAEQAIAGAIWRSDTAAVARLSKAYASPMQLIGKVQRAGAGWKADWIFLDAGRVSARSSNTHGNARVAMAAGADVVGDALVRKYVRRVAPKPVAVAENVEVTFTGIDTANEYLALIGYLEKHRQVGRIVPVSAGPDRAVFQLELKEGLSGFRAATAREGVVSADGDGAVFIVR